MIAGSYSSVEGPRYFQEIGLTASGGDREEVKRDGGEYRDNSLGEGVERKETEEEKRQERRRDKPVRRD